MVQINLLPSDGGADQTVVEMMHEQMPPLRCIGRGIHECGFPIQLIVLSQQFREGIMKNPPQQPGGRRLVADGFRMSGNAHDFVSHYTDGKMYRHDRSLVTERYRTEPPGVLADIRYPDNVP